MWFGDHSVHGSLVSNAKKLQGVQIAQWFSANAFLRSCIYGVCDCLPAGTPAADIFAELAKTPYACSLKCWIHELCIVMISQWNLLEIFSLWISDLPQATQASLYGEIT